MKSDSDSFFIDANVLVYAAVQDDPRYAAARALLIDSRRGTLHISLQILTEFYSTITSPKRVTVPIASHEAVAFIETLISYDHVAILPISLDVPGRLLAILKVNAVKGPHVFDLQIAATMLAHGVTKILTYNGADFRQIAGLEVFEPPEVGSLS
jgi:hypothetical protein